MTNYTYRPKPPDRGSYYSFDYELLHLPGIVVEEPDEKWQDSGLLDATGTRLMRKPERPPFGFLAGREAKTKS